MNIFNSIWIWCTIRQDQLHQNSISAKTAVVIWASSLVTYLAVVWKPINASQHDPKPFWRHCLAIDFAGHWKTSDSLTVISNYCRGWHAIALERVKPCFILTVKYQVSYHHYKSPGNSPFFFRYDIFSSCVYICNSVRTKI